MPLLPKLRTRMVKLVRAVQRAYYRRVWGMRIGQGVMISLKADLDFTNPRGLQIGDFTMITPRVQIFTHDFVKAIHCDTRIGSHCFVGAGAIILPGVTVGDHCIVAAGAVVTRDVAEGTMVAGNPAQVIRTGLKTGRYGMLVPTGD